MKAFLLLTQAALVFACLALPEGSSEPTGFPAREAAGARVQGAQDTAEPLARAERAYAEKSYAKAHELYAEAAKLELAPAQREWVEFRLADTRWRSAAQTNDPDTSELDRAHRELREMLERFERPETRTDLYAELHESLGDGTWRERSRDWGGAWAHYSAALEWWARSSDLETARARYLGIVWKASLPEWREKYWGHGHFPSYVPIEVLANAVEIATSDEERARAQFLLGRAWMNQGHDRRAAQRIEAALGAVLEFGKRSEWYDDALHALGTWFEGQGRWERDERGNLTPRPDFARALELYRRLVSEFQKGETRYFDEVQQRIRQITEPVLGLQVERFFLPGSEVQYALSWRNLQQVELELVPVVLTRDVTFAGDGGGGNNTEDWLASLALTRTAPVARWTHATQDAGKHQPGQARLLLAAKPEPGAYVLRARGAAREARALVLVSDVAVSTKVSGSKLLAWATDVRTGAPVPEADVRLWERWNDGSTRKAENSQQTGADGVALFELGSRKHGGQYFVALALGARQAFAQGWIPGTNDPQREWHIYAHTDRAAYRPGEPVQWKLWARTRFAAAYQTPAGEGLDWEIHDPQGSSVAKGSSTLDAFGAAWGTLETTASMTLGEYNVTFRRKGTEQHLGQAKLFRLEEYKLPEFEVSVKTPLQESGPGAGRPRLFRLGDRVEVDVQATYYYGAPVAGAKVEVFVHQRPRYRPFGKVREYPWFYDDAREISWWGGRGQQIFHDTRTSDPAGSVKVAFDTPADGRGEYEFVVEARVTDASRREITGSGSVVVAEQGYRVDFEIAHAIHRPGTKVEVALRASDPNDNPVEDDGKVTVTRETWREIWRDPAGRDVFDGALERAQGETGFGGAGWSLVSRGYERETIATLDVKTGADGKARFEFTPPKEGYYRIAWLSSDERGTEIRAEASLFVADENTRRLGYLPGGIEILVDQDTLAVGQEASILLLAPQSGRWVLFTVEGEELTRHEVLHLEGQVKLVKLAITEAHVPNVFLGALSLWGGQAFQDVQELIVPPVQQFLEVELSADRADYEPGSAGKLGVSVKDKSGAPVAATLSLAVVDEAVAYIQQDYAIDPRRFFYGQKRAQLVQTGGSFQHGTYTELVRDEKGEVRDRRFAKELGEEDRAAGIGGGRALRDQLGVAAPAEEMAADGFFLGKKSDMRQELSSQRMAGAAGQPVVRVRSDFRSTALWLPDVRTDEHGKAAVELTFPDSTTRWKASARAIDVGTRVGAGETSVRTRLPLIARLQAPRFFVVGDSVTISGNLMNNTDKPLTVEPALAVTGLALLESERPRQVTIPANGSLRVDWQVAVEAPGSATLKLSAVGAEASDAIERTLPVHPHGIQAFVDLAGKLDAGTEPAALELALVLPKERRPDSTSLTVTLAPSLAVTMLDALPYLVDYPYGCVEQTLSRFLPAVVVARTLRENGLSVEDAMTRVFGGIEPDTAGKTHPQGKQALAELDAITKAGLERLYDFQHSDGGWAWWKDGDSDRFMSAYVLWGLALAREAGIEVRTGVLANAARYLAAELVEAEREPDLAAWMLHALAVDGGAGRDADAKKFQAKAFEGLYLQRDALNAYGRALLCLAAHSMGRTAEARTLADNLRNGAIVERAPDTSVLQVGTHQPYTIPTAHWGQDGIFRRWSEGGVEATAFALRALMAVDPESELVTPVMNWLVKNRRGAQWSNTRDTAICVLALDEYLRASGELGSALEFELAVNGTSIASRRIEKDQLLSAPSTFEIDPALLVDGPNRVRIARKSGAGPLYFAARARFFSQEEPVPPRGNELFVRRDFYRLAARKTLLEGTVYERMPLADGDALVSGERVEVVLTLEAKNELEYIVVEDLKAAGLEAVQVRSGEPISAQELKRSEGAARFGAPEAGEGEDAAAQDARRRGTGRDVGVQSQVGSGYTGRARRAHQELRDRQVAFFLDKLPQGLWELRYELRAETPGRFHALPTLGHAMYVPEIHANGAELRLSVLESAQADDTRGR